MPAPMLLIALMAIFALASGCDSGQKTFFEPKLGYQHVAFVTPMGRYTGPGNPVYLPPNTRETLAIDGLPLYLSHDSYSLIGPKSLTSPHPDFLFVEAQVHLVPGTFELPRGDRPWTIKFQKVVIDKVIRVETFRKSK